MGASILWLPVASGVSLRVGTPSQFIEALGLPAEFDGGSVEFLRGVAAGQPAWRQSIQELLEAIGTHHRIRVWAEW